MESAIGGRVGGGEGVLSCRVSCPRRLDGEITTHDGRCRWGSKRSSSDEFVREYRIVPCVSGFSVAALVLPHELLTPDST